MAIAGLQTKLVYEPALDRLSVRNVLRHVGLPRRCRWDEARPLLKRLIVQSRRQGDERQAAVLSAIYAYLKARLYRTCPTDGCGLAIKPHAIKCQLHGMAHNRSPFSATSGGRLGRAR